MVRHCIPAPNALRISGAAPHKTMSIRSALLFCCLFLGCVPVCQAGEFRVSSGALERTLKARLFSTTDQHYYLRGDAHSACYLYAEDPHLFFSGDRIMVRVHTR